MRNRIDWLPEVTGHKNAEHISRAHLPRLPNRPDLTALNDLIEQHFGIRLERDKNKEWAAIDGKTLKGTAKTLNKQSVILVSRIVVEKFNARSRDCSTCLCFFNKLIKT